MKTINFCDIDLVQATREDFAKFAVEISRKHQSIISFSLNGESLAKVHSDDEFKKLFFNANYVHADGMSIVAASKLIKKDHLPERIATTDWFHDVAKISEKTGESHFFLGGSPKTIENTISNVKKLYPKLNIAGYRNGYFSSAEESEVLKMINDLKPNFVWVGLGRPKQERFSLKIRDYCNVGLIKTCGGLFDFLAGNNKRAPSVMQRIGLEWLFRLSLEPKRLFKRYFITNLQSIKIFMVYAAKR